MEKYSSDITINFGEKVINGKSIVSIMAACIKRGSEITVTCSGADEEAMLFEAVYMIKSGFGERFEKEPEGAFVLQGAGVSEGCGIGKAVIIGDIELDYSKVKYRASKDEKERLEKAVETFTAETRETVKGLKSGTGEKEAGILEGHLTMLADSLMLPKMYEKIDGGAVAEAAVDEVCMALYGMLSGVDDENMRYRAADVRDIRDRLLRILLGAQSVDVASFLKGSVIVARELTPSIAARINGKNVSAVVTEAGGTTSHSAILLRAMGIPAVFSALSSAKIIENGDKLIVDGFTGKVFTRPSEAEITKYREKQRTYLDEREGLGEFISKPTVTKSGIKKAIWGNIGKVDDVRDVIKNGGEGIGLFRTEFLFTDRACAPAEEEQLEAYSAVAKAMDGKEVIIRTLDVGGDKAVDFLKHDKEENPLLGLRGIRYCLKNKELFKTQLRALLRAAYSGNIKILLPLVTSPDEVKSTKELIDECAAELENEGLPYRRAPLGVMIETPAAALISDLLAKEVEFFSIGTNDLTGYTMAADRGNADVACLYDVINTAVLRLVEMTIKNAKKAGIEVSMCGEAAANESLIPRLVEWGLDGFSVTPAAILRTRKSVCECE